MGENEANTNFADAVPVKDEECKSVKSHLSDNHNNVENIDHLDQESGPEPEVNIVTDVFSYFSLRFPKSRDAVWVRGLSYEEEEETIAELRSKSERSNQTSGIFVVPLGENWLYSANFTGLLALVASIWLLLVADSTDEICASENVDCFLRFSRRRGETSPSHVYRLCGRFLILLPLSLYVVFLSYVVGVSTHHFTSLCAMGVAALYFCALIVQYVLLSDGISQGFVDDETEIDVILFLFYFATMVKLASPIVALLLVAQTVGVAMNKHRSIRVVKKILITPLILLLLAVGEGVMVERLMLSIRMLWIYWSIILSFSSFILTCIAYGKFNSFEIPVFIPRE